MTPASTAQRPAHLPRGRERRDATESRSAPAVRCSDWLGDLRLEELRCEANRIRPDESPSDRLARILEDQFLRAVRRPEGADSGDGVVGLLPDHFDALEDTPIHQLAAIRRVSEQHGHLLAPSLSGL